MKLFPQPLVSSIVPFSRPGLLAAILSLAPVVCEGAAAARLTINSGSGSMETSSTNTGGSFQLENNSTSAEKILSAKIDLSTAILPDVVFDPAGTAGDPDGKAFQQDSFTGTGTPTHAFESPHDGIGSEDGYDALRIDFGAGVSFGPGKTMTFSADIDPTSVKGLPGPGPEHSASVSGLELIGATVTVTFDNGTTRVVRLGGVSGDSNTNKMSRGVLSASNLATPVIAVTGKTPPFTLNANPTVRVTGPAGASGRLWVLYAELVDGSHYDIDPYESNKVVEDDYPTFTIGAGGFTDLAVNLANTNAPEGIKLLSAILTDSSGNRSSSSNIITIDYDPNGSGSSDTAAPSAPGNLTANSTTAASVTLGWTASTDPPNAGVAGYRIYRGATEVGTTQQTTFTDTGLTPSTTYAYQVKAYDAAGNQSAAASIEATTIADSQAPAAPGSLHANPGNGTVQLTWNAPFDEVGVTGYRIRRNGSPTPIATVSTLNHTDSGLSNGTAYTYDVRAIDAAGNESEAATITATPTLNPSALLRVNVGSSSSYLDSQGNTWAADYGYNTGYTQSNTLTILGTDKPGLYQTRRIDRDDAPELDYGLAVPNGDYRVVLHFVEVVPSVSFVGGRVFDVTAESALAVDNLDIFARVGENTALVIEVPVTVSDSQLNIGFLHGVNNPVLSGIEVYPKPPVVSPPTFEEWLAQHGLAGQTTGDSDGGGANNLIEYELQLDPNDPTDDLAFRLRCESTPSGVAVILPELKPLGDYHVHRSSGLADLADPGNRLATFTRTQIETMTPQQRTEQSVSGAPAGERAFYQLFFEPGGE
jgi:chitodextrinase